MIISISYSRNEGLGILTIKGFGLGAAFPSVRNRKIYQKHKGLGYLSWKDYCSQNSDDLACQNNSPTNSVVTDSGTPRATTAIRYSNAPGCNVVDLSKNACAYVDGTIGGCNSMMECDPLTGATHFQYGIPGPPVNTAIPLVTGQPVVVTTYANSPNPTLKNPVSGGSTITFSPSSQAQINSSILNALGVNLTSKFLAAGGNAPGLVVSPTSPNVSTAVSSNSSSPSSVTNVANGGMPSASAIPANPFQSVLGIPVPTGLLTGSLFGGIPNWALLGIGVVGLIFVFKGKG